MSIGQSPPAPATMVAESAGHASSVAAFAGQLTEGLCFFADTRLNTQDVLAWLRRNKYPLLSAEPVASAWLVEDPAFQADLAAEREWYEIQRAEYLRVRDAWLAKGIACLMFKSAGNQPAFPHLSDNLDLWVRPEHGVAARDTLRDLGYVEVRTVEEPQKYLFRKFHSGRCVSAIHLHEQVAWFVPFMDEIELHRRMRPSADDPTVNIPSPEDVILINLAHACYENKRVRFNDLVRVRFALKNAEGLLDWTYVERVAASRGWLDGLAYMMLTYCALEETLFGSSLVSPTQQARFEALLQRDGTVQRRLRQIRALRDLDLPLDLSYWLCKLLYYRKILADPSRTIAQRWRDVGLTLIWGIKLKSRIRPQAGMIITLSGADGSGKSAHAHAIVDALELCEVKTDYLWSRGGSAGVVHLINRLRQRVAGTPPGRSEMDSISRRRGRLRNPLARFAWAWLVAADQTSTYFFRAALPRTVGRVVVCDRYAYDTAVEMDASLPDNARWSRLAIRALLAFTPRPDAGYMLDVSQDTAQLRKSDEPFHADREAQREAYIALAERHGLRLISTEGPFAASNDLLIREVITHYMARFETWLNAVFLSNPSQRNAPDLAWVQSEGR